MSNSTMGWLGRRLGAPLFAMCLGLAVGCGGDDDDGDDGGDAGDDDGGVDAGVDMPDGAPGDIDGALDFDGAPADAAVGVDVCPLGPTLGIISLDTQEALQSPLDPEDPDGLQLRELFGQTDIIEIGIGLSDGIGAFEGGVVEPGEFTIGGDDADPTVCGLCISLTVRPPKAGMVFYWATAGTLTLTTVDGSLTGTATDLTFQEFTNSGQPIPDGCTTEVGNIPFDAVYTDQTVRRELPFSHLRHQR